MFGLMLRVSTRALALLAILLWSTAQSASQTWPLNRRIDVSNGFGEYRPGRFHAGIDLRTGGKVGAAVTSPVAGYLWRVSTSYEGYGKGVYIMGDDDYIYQFGHLSQLAPRINDPVKRAQLSKHRYYVDLHFPPDSLRISAGERIGYSGQTGAGAPHLHFEKRTADNRPLNPLRHGFSLDDSIPPIFERIGFRQVGPRALFDNASRQRYVGATRQQDGRFVADTVLYFNEPFAVLVDGFDMKRAGGMRQTVYGFKLYIDDQLYYQTSFDTLDFETRNDVFFKYEYLEAVDEHKRVRRLFEDPANPNKSRPDWAGAIGLAGNDRYGLHLLRIVAEDASGNSSELTCPFFWVPKDGLFVLDSISLSADDDSVFYFHPRVDLSEYAIDSILVLRNLEAAWGIPRNIDIDFNSESGALRCEVNGSGVRRSVLRLLIYSATACLIVDPIFHGLQAEGKHISNVSHEVVADGVRISIFSPTKYGSKTHVELYYKGELLGVEYPRYFSMQDHVCIVPPLPKYARIDEIRTVMSRDLDKQVSSVDSVDIYLVGMDEEQVISPQSGMRLRFRRSSLFGPRFIEVKSNNVIGQARLQINSAHYQLFPRAFACAGEFEISIKPQNAPHINQRSGVCWLDEKENKWVWLGNEKDGSMIRGPSLGGGSFAAIYDFDPPTISKLTPASGKTYYQRNPTIKFLLEDTLSGIEDDRSILIKLDGNWMIPEYDPESRVCFTEPMERLSLGKHHLSIEVTDRAGNKAEQYLSFFVREQKKRSSR